MAKEGQATEDEVPSYVPKNVITRSLGPHPTVAVDIEGPFPLSNGDRYLLCSDGLTGPLKPELIGMVLSALPLSRGSANVGRLSQSSGRPRQHHRRGGGSRQSQSTRHKGAGTLTHDAQLQQTGQEFRQRFLA